MSRIVLPDGVDGMAVLGDALHSAWRTHSEWRRLATRLNPVLFAYTYLLGHLSSAETAGVTSLARHHLDMAAAAVRWVRPGAHRTAWVAPRGSAKTTWAHLILPLWALAHGHRRFLLAFGDAEAQAVQHLADVRTELDRNELLRHDFPDLAPARGRNRATEVVCVGGAAFAARGMDSRALGVKIGAARPDLLVLDDIEPEEGNYSPGEVQRRRTLLLDKILPMNEQAVVAVAGTVTMHGSLMHDVVRAAAGERVAWLDDAGFACRHHPAILVDGEGVEHSYWPERHPLAYLHSIRHTRSYALNFAGRPPLPGGTLWTEAHFRYPDRPVPVEGRAVFVDVAMSGPSTRRRHDFTALAVVARPRGRRDRAVVEYARAWRMSFVQLSATIAELCARNPDVRDVHVEVNAFGGEEAMRASVTVPAGVRLVPYRVTESKEYRIRRSLRRYEEGRVVHATRLPEYEAQAVAYPDVEHDDLVDVVAAGIEHVLDVEA